MKRSEVVATIAVAVLVAWFFWHILQSNSTSSNCSNWMEIGYASKSDCILEATAEALNQREF